MDSLLANITKMIGDFMREQTDAWEQDRLVLLEHVKELEDKLDRSIIRTLSNRVHELENENKGLRTRLRSFAKNSDEKSNRTAELSTVPVQNKIIDSASQRSTVHQSTTESHLSTKSNRQPATQIAAEPSIATTVTQIAAEPSIATTVTQIAAEPSIATQAEPSIVTPAVTKAATEPSIVTQSAEPQTVAEQSVASQIVAEQSVASQIVAEQSVASQPADPQVAAEQSVEAEEDAIFPITLLRPPGDFFFSPLTSTIYGFINDVTVGDVVGTLKLVDIRGNRFYIDGVDIYRALDNLPYVGPCVGMVVNGRAQFYSN